MTPMKAIRAKCLDCCCGQVQEVRLCPCADCPLYPYRMGRRPKNAAVAAENQGDEREGDNLYYPHTIPPKILR